MKKETRKTRLRRLSYQVAEAAMRQPYDRVTFAPRRERIADAYVRGYKRAMTDLRRDVARYYADGRPDEAFSGFENVVAKFLGGVR